MTHEESLATLLAAPSERGAGAVRQQAEAHVADCSDCWETLALLHALANGTPPPDVGRMRGLYGCDRVREDLFDLVGLRADDIRASYPLAARHLSWCDPCRVRFAELAAVERVAARGELGPAVTASRPQWRDVMTALGRHARELAGTVVAQVREGFAVITTVPAGLVLVPVPVMAGARRGAHGAAGTTPSQRVQVPIGDEGEAVDVTILTRPGGRVAVEARLVPAGAGARTVSLRAVRDDGEELVGSQTARGEAAVVFRDLPPGRYVLGIQAQAAPELRIPLAITSAG
jgi:hypothetical protein